MRTRLRHDEPQSLRSPDQQAQGFLRIQRLLDLSFGIFFGVQDGVSQTQNQLMKSSADWQAQVWR